MSPLIGFVVAGLLRLVKALLRRPEWYRAATGKVPPPWWIRGLLVLTCTGVSFAHGSIDGEKGVRVAVALALGFGTMIGWKRIVVHPTFAPGACAELLANGYGIQRKTVRNIILVWVLTSPVCVLLGAALFAAGLFFVLRMAGVP